MGTDVEAFRFGAVTTGVLVRSYGDGAMSTQLVFESPDGRLVDLYQQTVFDDVRAWAEFTYRDDGDEIRVFNRRTADASRRTPSVDVGAAIPSYAAHDVLRRFIHSDAPDVHFEQFAEAVHPAPTRARFVREGSDELVIDGARIPARRIRLYVDARPGNTFWTSGTTIVMSDWGGAQSYPVTDLDAVLHSLSPRARALAVALVEAGDA